ncbi:GMC oxidoreductase [Microdochium trichocladiopsis]|uniref:GMC oxidoreductase n=1 Tax=Microdochium trichocladiopsis TaxID=1682393 RepID=A0A9P9BFD8_9PEZI|nr:GMC oxidoreductase [Microdochium trichocladiopsis]KAH7010906.1 GMC oxidoreductase [Microdochium trichocladiopsis]
MQIPLITLKEALLLALGEAAAAQVEQSAYDYIVAGAGAAGIVAAEQLSQSGRKVLLLERGGPSLYSTGNTQQVLTWNDTMTTYEARPSWHWDVPKGIAQAAAELYEHLPGTNLASEDGKRYDDAAFDITSRFLLANGWSETDAIKDPEAKELVYAHPAWSIANGLRDTPVRKILDAAKARACFSLQLGAKVLRAVRTGSKVTGVEVERADGTREIIPLAEDGALLVAAGTHSTPRVLFNSGIGPAAQIDIVAGGTTNWIELPVGRSLKNHAVATITLTGAKENVPALPATAFPSPSQENIDLFAHSSGVLMQSSQRLNFWTSLNTTTTRQYAVQGTVRAGANSTISIQLYLTHGTSSLGEVSITPDGKTNMTISPLLRSAEDREAMSAGVNMFLEYARLPDSILTVADNVTAEAILTKIASGAHNLGTAQMRVSNDGKSVVDEDTKVWGTDNLFVVDGSFHPKVPTGNTQAPIMIAAKYAAKRILALRRDW